MLCYTTQCQVPYIATHKDVATKLTRSCLTHILVYNGHNKINFVNFVIKSERKKRQGIKNDTLSYKVIPEKKPKKNPSEINH